MPMDRSALGTSVDDGVAYQLHLIERTKIIDLIEHMAGIGSGGTGTCRKKNRINPTIS